MSSVLALHSLHSLSPKFYTASTWLESFVLEFYPCTSQSEKIIPIGNPCQGFEKIYYFYGFDISCQVSGDYLLSEFVHCFNIPLF